MPSPFPSDRGASARFRPTPRLRQYGSLTRPLIALIALTVLGVSATAITYLVTHRDQPLVINTSPLAKPPAAPIFLPLEPFTVTLTNTHSERLMHVGLTLKVADEDSQRRLNSYLPVLRSRILLLLTEQDAEQVQSRAGKRELANAVRHAANMPVEGDAPQHVVDVLFNAFVVQ